MKPDALTCRWDVNPKEGSSGYASVNPHNFHPVFTSEQIQHSLRATSLLIPVLRSSVIMDLETLHNDIRNSLHSDPFAIRYIEIPNLTHDGNLTTMVYSGAITVSMYQMLMIFTSKYCSTSTITYCQDIMVRTRHYVKSDKNMSGPNSDPSSNTFATLVSSASVRKLLIINLMGYSDLFQFRNVRGILYPWISLNNFLPPMALQLSSLL